MNYQPAFDPIHLDFEQARVKHLLFKARLRSFLYGANIEEAPVVYHYQCTVGKWIYGHALHDYAAVPEMHELERVHAELHTEARRLITLYKEGKVEKAREGWEVIEKVAERLVSLLTLIEIKVQQSPTSIVSNSTEQNTATINVEELYELQRLNLELDRRMKEQDKELYRTNQNLQLAISIGGLGVYKIQVTHPELLTNTATYSGQVIDWFNLSGQGLPLSQILSKVHPEEQAFVKETLEHSLSRDGDGKHDITFRLISSKEGTLRHLRSIGQVQYEKGTPVSISGILQEVTEQVLSRQKIEASEAELQQRVIERTAELEKQKTFVSTILDASFNGVYALQAVRNESGVIADFCYLFVNNFTARFFAAEPKELVGKSMLALIPENKNNGFFDLFCRVLEKGEPVQEQTHFVAGTINNWFDYTIVPIDKDILVVTLQDITEQKKAALHIEEQKNLLDNILKHSPSGITVVEAVRDSRGEVVDFKNVIANDRTAEHTGLPKKLSLSKPFGEIDSNFTTSPYFKKAVATLGSGESFLISYYMELTGKWLEVATSKMDEEHLINVFTNVTEHKKMQLQLEKSVEALKRSNANLEEFAYAASHDLKEPIRKIHTFSDRIKMSLAAHLKEQDVIYFERMEAATKRMNSLIEDLLRYSQVSVRPAHFEQIDMNGLMAIVLEDLDVEIEQKGASIKVDKLFTIRGHSRQLQQAFQNLISNGLKYSKPDVPPEIKVSCSKAIGKDTGLHLSSEDQEKEYYVISIMDNGIGFEQEAAERIFTMFTRLHSNTEYKGTGIGLSIVRKVVVNHGGYITAQSEEGTGATFKVFLPVE